MINVEILGEPLTIAVNENINKLIYSYKTKNSENVLSIALCVDEQSYEIVFTTNSINTISYNVKLNSAYLKSEELHTFSFIHRATITPSLTAIPTIHFINKQLYLGVNYYLFPSEIRGKGCTSFSQGLNNYMPASMDFNSVNGGITGKLMGKFVDTISINCIEGVNSYPATVKYTVKSCPAYSTNYELKITSVSDGNNIIVDFESSIQRIYQIYGVMNTKTYVLSGCIQYSSFKITLDSKSKTSWSIGSKVTLTFNGETKEFIFVGGSPLIVTESSYSRISGDPQWMYSDVIENNWNNNFETSLWSRSALSMVPQVSATTRYYRIIYDLILDYNTLDSFLVTTSFSGGMVFFVNGVEVMRKDLPLLSDQNTRPSENTIKVDYEFEISGNLLRKGINYMGVEIHRNIPEGGSVSDGTRIQIRALASLNKCVAKTLFSTMTPKMEVEHDLDGVVDPNTIDLNYNTNFIGTSTTTTLLGNEIVYKYPISMKKSFNEYSIVTTSNCPNGDLLSWEVHGNYLGDATFTKIDEIVDSKMIGDSNTSPGSGRSTVYNYKIFNSYKAYASYKFTIKSLKSITNSVNATCSGKYGFSEFYVSICKELVCSESNGYSSTRIGTKSYRNCEEGKIGRKEKSCGLLNGIPTWGDETEVCSAVSTSISYGTSNLHFSVGLFKEYPAQLGSGEKGYLEIVGMLPLGVLIDEKTGNISGTSTAVLAASTTYVKFIFLSGVSLVSQKLTVEAECNPKFNFSGLLSSDNRCSTLSADSVGCISNKKLWERIFGKLHETVHSK